MLPPGTKYAPDVVLKSTRCNCKGNYSFSRTIEELSVKSLVSYTIFTIWLICFLFSASQCKTNACSCAKAKMSCSEFCGCGDEGDTNECQNKWNENQYDSDDEDENEDEIEDEDQD